MEQEFAYGGKSFLVQKDELGHLKVFRKLKKGLVELHGQQAYKVVRAYKLKIEKTPSIKKPRLLAKKAKRKKY